MTRSIIRAVAAVIGAAALAAPALAEPRLPTAEERGAIETMLRAAHFVSWGDIVLDDDGAYWEVDDARTTEGRKYDLRVTPGTLDIVSREPDK